MSKRLGRNTVVLSNRPAIIAGAALAGKKEGEGPLGQLYDAVVPDDLFGEESWEKAEQHFFYTAAATCLNKAGVTPQEVDVLLGGDLLNQIMAASMAARELGTPFLGLYGACSTMAESLCVGAMLVDGGHMRNALCAASSHFCTAERQYRFPLEYGSQRTPTAQWTVTGAGAALISAEVNFKPLARCAMVTVGTVTDMGIADANNMGAAMAPAAYDTLSAFFRDTGYKPADFDLILTGDLGELGHAIVRDFFQRDGVDMGPQFQDCGLLLYDRKHQDMHAGASGCGCSASVLNGYLLRKMREGKWKTILFAPTGALLSPTSSGQGESIPSICHAVRLSAVRE